ncbi:arsenate-mycothiol transferase ArsC [Dietzia sp.]|uniref:arsenate-mycothiol transferase ArsC n=1 Tax=Dietzia sp. TaxID=1871616 RepID=UPI002FD98B21
MDQPAKPSVLFVCVKNAGKSQMAAALMRHLSHSPVQVYSAGTRPGNALNDLSVTTLAEVGAGVDGEYPKPIEPAILRSVNRVIVIGEEAIVEPIPGMVGTIDTWTIDEPSARGIEGIERMRLVRDQLADKVHRLDADLANQTPS